MVPGYNEIWFRCKEEIMRFAGKCKELENIILRKPGVRETNLFHVFILVWILASNL